MVLATYFLWITTPATTSQLEAIQKQYFFKFRNDLQLKKFDQKPRSLKSANNN